MYIENIFHDKIDLRSFYFHVTKSRVLSGLYTPLFGLNVGVHSINANIQYEHMKIWT